MHGVSNGSTQAGAQIRAGGCNTNDDQYWLLVWGSLYNYKAPCALTLKDGFISLELQRYWALQIMDGI